MSVAKANIETDVYEDPRNKKSEKDTNPDDNIHLFDDL